MSVQILNASLKLIRAIEALGATIAASPRVSAPLDISFLNTYLLTCNNPEQITGCSRPAPHVVSATSWMALRLERRTTAIIRLAGDREVPLRAFSPVIQTYSRS